MKTVVVTGASTGIGWGCVKVLIAAGSRVFGSVRKQADGDRLSKEFGPNFEQQLTVNVTGQLIVTQAFAPLLGVDRSRKGAPGRIVMISSVGGKNAMPFLGAYSASK